MKAIQAAIVLACCAPCFGQYGPPPDSEKSAASVGYGVGGGYSLNRWEEDYSYLRDPKQRTDFWDPIKYVPLSEGGDFYLSFGGQARYRYDYFNNPSFGPGSNDEDGFHLTRYLLHMDAHLGEHFRVFVQGDASFIDGREGGGRYGDTDHGDLTQAFLDINTSNDSDPHATLRIGRQELTYGAQRLVSPDDWRNVRRSFDGAKLAVSIPNNTTEIFLTKPVIIEREEFDNDDNDSTFGGIYNVTALPGFIPDGNSKLEVYGFSLFSTGTSQLQSGITDMELYNVGTRFVSRPYPWDFDIEGDYQFGERASDDISAWSVATELGYTISPWTFSPRASVGFDIASGSSDPSGRFNQLFPPTYNYLGHIYLFGRENLIDAHVGLDFHLTKDVTFYVAHHTYWRQNDNDALYNLSGAVVRADNGTDAAYVGNEIDFSLTAQFTRHINGYIGWAHFFAGDFISDTGASKDVDFLYASLTYTF